MAQDRRSNRSGGNLAPPDSGPRKNRVVALLMEAFGFGRGVTITGILFVLVVLAAAIFFFIAEAPPTTITITSGPEGSGFHSIALQYRDILRTNYHVKAIILPSHGSIENLARLKAAKKGERPSPSAGASKGTGSEPSSAAGAGKLEPADVGFVQSDVIRNANEQLMSLGSVAYQPMMIFYRGQPIELLSQLAGKRLSVGARGSGTRALALLLLRTNGIAAGSPASAEAAAGRQDHGTTGPQDHGTTGPQDQATAGAQDSAEGAGTSARPSPLSPRPSSTTLLDWEPTQAYKALLAGEIDAAFLMGEDASVTIMRGLLRAPDIHLFNFTQGAAYTRKLTDLSLLQLPQGSIDFGKNIPAQDIQLIGPTVELVARKSLHPALSDLLLETAREVHGRATLLQRKNEFPAPIEHELNISTDALRYYKSGRSFWYRYLPFWLASIASRVVLVFLPAIVVLIPVVRSIPHFYRWRIRSRILRWYRALLAVEGDLFGKPAPGRANGDLPSEEAQAPDSAKRERLLRRLDEIETAVNRMRLPASFADQFYGLREHISLVREMVEGATAPEPRQEQRS